MTDRSSAFRLVLDSASLLKLVTPQRDLGRKQQRLNRLICAVEHGSIELCVPRAMAYAIHDSICEDYGLDQANEAFRYIHAHCEFEPPSLELDLIDHRISKLRTLPGDCDLEDAYLLAFAEAVSSHVILSEHVHSLERLIKNNSKVFPRFHIHIWEIDWFWDHLLDNFYDYPAIFEFLSPDSTMCVLMKNREPTKLPKNATPVDLAYKIHTELGNHCHRAIVNGREFPLDAPLHEGDWVEIETSPQISPQEAWLKTVITRAARSNIRRWHDKAARDRGWDQLKSNLSPEQLEKNALTMVARQLSFRSRNELAQKIGSNEVSIDSVVFLLSRQMQLHQSKLNGSTQFRYSVHLAGCCQPLPGDPIMGLSRFSEHVYRIHHQSCNHIADTLEGRRRMARWAITQCSIEITIRSYDRPGLLRDVLRKMEYILSRYQNKDVIQQDIAIDVRQVKTHANREALLKLILPPSERSILFSILQDVRDLKDVLSHRLKVPEGSVFIQDDEIDNS